MRPVVVLVVTLAAASAGASPNVSLDDPRYEQLGLTPHTGGFWPLSEARMRRLLGAPRIANAWWVSPVRRFALTGYLLDADERSYSTVLRPRDLTVGKVAVFCERREGRPCDDGPGGFAELDVAAGYGASAAAVMRFRMAHDDYAAIDRLYLHAEVGPVAAEVGRDVVVFGPSSRTQVSWGTNAPPLDHFRLSTSEPLPLTSSLRGNAVWVVGRARDPQHYPDNLVSIARVQLDIANNVEVGLMQMLQLGGDGAPHIGLWDFIAEHVRRRDFTATETDSSNRRFGGDVAFRMPGARIYYSVIFEDIRRKRLIDAIRYDADHLLGIDTRFGRHGAVLEVHQTGVRSQEHWPRITGFTNAGRVVGSPLGPDALSLFVGGRLDFDVATLYPWLELAQLESDTYRFVVDGPIERIAYGQDEGRYRAGLRARVPLQAGMWIEGEALVERIDDFAFEPGVSRINAGVTASIIWYPDGPLGRLSLK